MGVFTYMQEQELEILFQRYINKTATEAEKQAFFELIRLPGSDEILLVLAERYPVPDSTVVELPQESSGQILAAILGSEDRTVVPVRRLYFTNLKMKQVRWAAAAIIIGIMAVTGWLVLRDHKGYMQNSMAKTDIKAPITNRAIITLANGQTVYLDSAINGKLASIGNNMKLVKLADGQIAYSGTSDKIEYNTVTNPRGSNVIDMAFVDGSHVWLNAGSSITYPVPFEGNERKVKINGEAYFEIAHDAAKPFKVTKADMEITVLGTHFNVNAYDDETESKVTLLEGSVKISKGSDAGLLKPGQQAQINTGINIKNDIDVEGVMAWKNGLFSFKSTDIKTRWYDVEVDYAPGVPEDETITGDITRTANMSEMMKMLESAGVHFKIEGKRVTVMR